jgi:hypothetical protein
MNLKLAVVSHQSLSTLGGISVHIRQLAEALTDLGVKVEVIAPVSKPARQYTSYSFEIMPIPLTRVMGSEMFPLQKCY